MKNQVKEPTIPPIRQFDQLKYNRLLAQARKSGFKSLTTYVRHKLYLIADEGLK